MSAQAATKVSKIPMRMRLKAWWNGDRLEIRQKGAPDQSENSAKKTNKTKQLDTVALTQALWGEGMRGPGDSDYIQRLAKPMGLDPSMTILDLGAGLGGPARIMAEQFGPWVNGLESNKSFAEAGMLLSEKVGLAKKAAIGFANPESHVYRPKAVDGVFSKEFFFKIREKEQVLESLASHLKERGRLLMTDYVRPPEVSPDQLENWIANDPDKPNLWTAEQYESLFQSNQLDLRIHEDMTEEHVEIAKKAWHQFMQSPLCKQLEKTTGDELVKLGEAWGHRIQCLENGSLKVIRFFALKRVSTDLN